MNNEKKVCYEDEIVETNPCLNPIVSPLGQRYDLYLCSEITEPKDYLNWFNILNHCSEDDMVYIHINSCGGYLNTSLQLKNAIELCNANVIISIEGACSSGASVVMLGGNQFIISPTAYVMCHTWIGGFSGKASDIKTQSSFDEKWWKKTANLVYQGFMTDKEIEEMLNGKDFWFDADEVQKRLNNRSEFILKKVKKELKKNH